MLIGSHASQHLSYPCKNWLVACCTAMITASGGQAEGQKSCDDCCHQCCHQGGQAAAALGPDVGDHTFLRRYRAGIRRDRDQIKCVTNDLNDIIICCDCRTDLCLHLSALPASSSPCGLWLSSTGQLEYNNDGGILKPWWPETLYIQQWQLRTSLTLTPQTFAFSITRNHVCRYTRVHGVEIKRIKGGTI